MNGLEGVRPLFHTSVNLLTGGTTLADSTEEVRRLGMGRLLSDVSLKMQQKATQDEAPRILVHSTHDTTLAAICATFDVFDERYGRLNTTSRRVLPNPVTFQVARVHVLYLVRALPQKRQSKHTAVRLADRPVTVQAGRPIQPLYVFIAATIPRDATSYSTSRCPPAVSEQEHDPACVPGRGKAPSWASRVLHARRLPRPRERADAG